MTTLEGLAAMRQEHDAWRKLMRAMWDAGILTTFDREAPMSVRSTPGTLVLALIREWGDELVKLRTLQQAER